MSHEQPDRHDYLGRLLRWFLGLNPITMFGVTLSLVSVFSVVLLLGFGLAGVIHTAYMGLIIFVLVPIFVLMGLVMIPIGAWFSRRRLRGSGGDSRVITLDLSNWDTRRAIVLVAILTFVNINIVSAVAYKGYQYTESVQFCGLACHTPMEPVYTAYLDSPHSSVRCAECHIGPGTSSIVQAKINGVRQLISAVRGNYATPTPTPVENLRPAREICEECHRPDQFSGDRLKVKSKFSDDEANTPMKTVLLMHIGGGHSNSKGIHSWHIAEGRQTLYLAADKERQKMALVRVKEADGSVVNYAAGDFERDPATVPDDEMRVMDCIDCHNRPTHVFKLQGQAMDEAMAAGKIDNTLPYIKKLGVEALTGAADAPDYQLAISKTIRDYYAENNADLLQSRKDTVDKAISEVQAIFARNVFPKMKVTWGTYPDNLSHIDFPGCFRCHDDAHSSKEGKAISQDCTSCHNVLAWDEEDPKILEELGLK